MEVVASVCDHHVVLRWEQREAHYDTPLEWKILSGAEGPFEGFAFFHRFPIGRRPGTGGIGPMC